MITELSRRHIELMLQDMKRREERNAKGERDFYDYTYREIAKALRDYLGQDEDYCVIYYFVDSKTIGLEYAKQWITIFYDQLKIFL